MLGGSWPLSPPTPATLCVSYGGQPSSKTPMDPIGLMPHHPHPPPRAGGGLPPYYSHFQDEAQAWEGKLSFLTEALPLLVTLQRKWVSPGP